MARYVPATATLVSIIAGIFGIIFILWSWHLLPFLRSMYQQTNEAYISGQIFPLSMPEQGTVVKLYVKDYQDVKEGDAIAEFEPLEDKEIFSDTELRSKQIINQFNSMKVKNNLSNKIINAPFSGKLSSINVYPGQYVAKFFNIAYLVGNKRTVVAEFKDTQISYLKPNQPVEIIVKSYDPNRRFYGHITGVAPANMAALSGLSSEVLMSGNLEKWGQRVRVDIDFDSGQSDIDKLLPGMSAFVKLVPDDSKNIGP